ncbi:unnamed protein product [Victoria cruziana]
MGACISAGKFGDYCNEVQKENSWSVDQEEAQKEDARSGGGRVCCTGPCQPPNYVSLYSQQGKKGPNQDAVVFCQDYATGGGAFCGVFDGHGHNGHHVSKRARDWLPAVLLRQWRQWSALEGAEGKNGTDAPTVFDVWKESLFKAFMMMDKELRVQQAMDFSCSGTTAVTIIKQGDDLIVANLGDSRAVLGSISEDGALTAIQLTTDLKPSVPQEAERIKRCNGRIFALPDEPKVQRVWLPNDNYPGLAMARAFGDFRLKSFGIIAVPQVSYRRLAPADQFIILATDGVWDVLSNKQVASIVWSARSREMAAKMVVESAVHEWRCRFPSSKMDDCSAVCLFLRC